MLRTIVFHALSLLCFSVFSSEAISTIAFGSCLRQWKPQPIWDSIVALRPDVFLFIGDNVYANATDVQDMHQAYAQLASQTGYQRLQAICPVYATWDDHDYGTNNAGSDYPMREASEQVFLDFFGVPENAPARHRPGVYSAQMLGPPERRVQIILLDTRYFRSPLREVPTTRACPRLNLAANTDPDATILGEDQWRWLAEQLDKPARLRIIASSIQVIPEQHCFEKWANFPNERNKLFRTIRESGASGVVLISGDRHLAEISRLEASVVGYPLYELTSSGMNSARAGKGEDNRHRVNEDNYRDDNFGVVTIDWVPPSPLVQLQVRDVSGRVVRSHALRLTEIQAPSQSGPK